MKTDCLDMGTIQAFLDGELTPAMASAVSGHISMCDVCSLRLAQADEESALVFSVLEREMNSLVPTQRLWIKISDSISAENQAHASFWQKAGAFVTVQLANPSVMAAAGMLVVLGLFAAVVVQRDDDTAESVVQSPSSSTSAISSLPPVSNNSAPGSVAVTTAAQPREQRDLGVTTAEIEPARRTRVKSDDAARPVVVNAAYIPGEESYVKTIANLSETVDEQKDTVLRPSERISYERDMAVVDDAIERLKREVRKNPRNESAKQVLYTSYQNKIDLLNSVSQREELIASIR